MPYVLFPEYVDEMLLLYADKTRLEKVLADYKSREPNSLTSQFTSRHPKVDVVLHQTQRKVKLGLTALYVELCFVASF